MNHDVIESANAGSLPLPMDGIINCPQIRPLHQWADYDSKVTPTYKHRSRPNLDARFLWYIGK